MNNSYVLLDDDSIIIKVWDRRASVVRECFIDAADLPLVDLRTTWTAEKDKGNGARRGYLKWYATGKLWVNGKNKTILMHRMILGLTDPKIETDHRDNDGLNNRRGNLRECSHIENRRFHDPDKDWAALDAARELATEYRNERQIAVRVQSAFGLGRQAMWCIRREKTTTSPAAIAYREACIGVCRPHWQMRTDHPVGNVKWGAVLVVPPVSRSTVARVCAA